MAIDPNTTRLFQEVAERLGWTGPTGLQLDEAEDKLLQSIGKSRRPAVCSNTNSHGKENKSDCKPLLLDSSDDDFDVFLSQKATPKPPSRKPLQPAQTNSPSVRAVSSASDDDFEDFLSRVKTPKPKAVASGERFRNDSVKQFIVNGSSSDGDFVKDSRKKSAAKGTPKPPPVKPQCFSPVFVSDDDDDDAGVVIRSTWRSRHTPRAPVRDPVPCTSAPSKLTHVSPNPGSDSEEEFLSLLERLKKNHGNASTEPVEKPSSVRIVKKDPVRVTQSLSTPIHTADRPLPVRQTEPRNKANGAALCKTSGCFLLSLSTPGSLYNRSFKQHKEELTGRLYRLYNSSVFEDKLPADMSVTWNKKMRKTAGFCITGQQRGGGGRYARIELSEKVCDSADRLRDTLVHEMCHAATWLINGVRDGHGSFWKLYARKATLAHPELPVVTRCHTYDINYKYQYQCSRCKNTIGRHSKSLDTQRFVCALCTGQLVLLTPARARGPAPFAAFVKENYGSAREELQGQSHAEVMRKLSADFAAKAQVSRS